MAIYRGPGGPGDATADQASTAQLAQTYATNAANSAAAAAISASTASSAQAAAEAAQASAEAAETGAESAESNAETAQSAAEAAQLAAEAAQTAAETAETNAEAAEASAISASVISVAASVTATSASATAVAAATTATSAATAAEAARDAALSAYDNFDDRYLGQKSSDPSVDNDGNALLTGALYFNTVDNAMRVYTGVVWVDAYSAGTTFLAKANNLSDLPNTTTARTNLGLGTAATTNSTDYATAAQGSNADSAYGWGDHALAGYLDSADIGVTVQGYDATTLKSADIGVTVQGYDANTLKSGDIGVTVQGYDADTVKYDDVNPSFTNTGAIKIPVGTELQRPGTPVAGQLRFNDDDDAFEGYNGTAWAPVGGGNSTSNGLWENSNTISANYTIGTNFNAMSAGPVTVDSGVTVTVPSGSRWIVL